MPLRDLGLLPINRVAAAKADTKQPRRKDGRREEKSTRVETKTITLADGSTRTVELYARGGAIGIGDLTETGDLRYTELRRVRTHRNRDKSRKYRWYNDYRLPDNLDAGIVTVRLHGTPDDTAPRTSDPSRRLTPTSPSCTPVEMTPSRSTATSTTHSGCAALTASDTTASTSTCSATPSW